MHTKPHMCTFTTVNLTFALFDVRYPAKMFMLLASWRIKLSKFISSQPALKDATPLFSNCTST